jgi:hypothetical protein
MIERDRMGKGDRRDSSGDVDELLAQYLDTDTDDESAEGKSESGEQVRALTDELEALLVAAERSQTGPQRSRVTPTEPLHVVQTGDPPHDEFGRNRTGPRMADQVEEGADPFARQPTGPFGTAPVSGTQMLPTVAPDVASDVAPDKEFDAAQTTYRGKRSARVPTGEQNEAAQELAQDAPTATVLPPPVVVDDDDEGDNLAPDEARQTMPGWSPDELD